MEKVKENLTKKLTIRVKPAEYAKLFNAYKSGTHRKFSEYIRNVLLEKPVTVYTRNKSIDDVLTDLIRLRSGMSSVANNFNQVVKKINYLNAGTSALESWLQVAERNREKLLLIASEINQKIAQLSDQWLQE